jgi:hypothetical protein
MVELGVHMAFDFLALPVLFIGCPVNLILFGCVSLCPHPKLFAKCVSYQSAMGWDGV